MKEKKELMKRYDVFDENLELGGLFKDENKMLLMDKMKKRKLQETKQDEILKFNYIGETSRSAYERGVEHFKDLEYKRPKSHMLKHCVIYHPDLDPKNVEFRMKILSSHGTAFERQIREAVLINHYSGVRSMNSKLEYNRCSIPTMLMKTGNNDENNDTSLEQEKTANEKIKLLYGDRERKRNVDGATRNQNTKRRKVDLETNMSGKINLHDEVKTRNLHDENSQLKSTELNTNKKHFTKKLKTK